MRAVVRSFERLQAISVGSLCSRVASSEQAAAAILKLPANSRVGAAANHRRAIYSRFTPP